MSETIRIDKWLWYARFCKTRSIAQLKVENGHIRLNGKRVEKPSMVLRNYNTLTFPMGEKIITVKVLGLGTRRGPASEAQQLYEIIES